MNASCNTRTMNKILTTWTGKTRIVLQDISMGCQGFLSVHTPAFLPSSSSDYLYNINKVNSKYTKEDYMWS